MQLSSNITTEISVGKTFDAVVANSRIRERSCILLPHSNNDLWFVKVGDIAQDVTTAVTSTALIVDHTCRIALNATLEKLRVSEAHRGMHIEYACRTLVPI